MAFNKAADKEGAPMKRRPMHSIDAVRMRVKLAASKIRSK